jgi:ligand-binding sensor domain-containing protein/signal transduction histidine kinase
MTAAALPGFSARIWQIEDGLPHNVVQAITQTQDGYLWVGTRQGLARFDGVSFTPLDLASNEVAPSVTSLAAGQDGGLWIGTGKKGLFRFKDGLLSHYGPAEGLKSREILRLLTGGDGSLWIASRGGMARWQNGQIKPLTDSALTTNEIMSLCLDAKGALWMGASRGVQRLEDQIIFSSRTANGHPLRAIRALFSDSEGTLWIGGGNGLTLEKEGVFRYYPKGEGATAIISAILRDRAGNVWVGTQGGLSRFDGEKFQEEPPQEETASCAIHALFEDREGSLWVGSAKGLERLTGESFVTYTKQHGLSQNVISSLCAGRDGSIWIGTWGGGLNRLKDESITTYNKSNGLSSDFVVALAEARDGTLWAGTAYAHDAPGLDRLKDGQISPNRLATEQISPAITVLLEDRQGIMWAGSRNGLGCFKQGKFTACAGQNAPANRPVNALCAGRDGCLWIGTESGLMRWSNGRFDSLDGQKSGPKTFVLSLYEDAEGELWIGTMGEGLVRLANGTFKKFSTQQGLLSDSIYSILEDRRHDLWLQSGKGLFRVGKKQFDELARGTIQSLNCIGYGKADGILGSGEWQEATRQTQPAQPAACKGADGRFWFRTSEGVAVTDPDKIMNNDLPPPVVIERIVADRQPILPPPPNRDGARPPDFLKIAPGRGELEFHYTALSLVAPEKNRFRYRLAGSDPDWVDAGGRRVAYYNHLAPGRYTFHVAGCNNDGVWNETGAAISLKLLPHPWQTWWFLGACGAALVACVGGGARHITRTRMQRKLERLGQLNAIETERARIARDMHDELGAKLARISFQAAIAVRSLSNPAIAEQEIGKIAHTARALVSSLEEIVWAVDPGNDSLENLATYICRYAGDLFQNSPMTCEFRIPANLPDCRLSSDARHNVFLAVKEALTNVLKHSQAARVQIGLDAGDGQFDIVISDDGRGFDPGAPPGAAGRKGHGLANLRRRLELINGSCELTSKPGGGTRVAFVIPLPPGTQAGVSSNHTTIKSTNSD